MFLFDWLFLTVVGIIVGYLFFKMYYYKNIYEKEQQQASMVDTTLHEAEALIRKYQIQLQRSLGNIELLNDELNKIRTDLKNLKARNGQYRIENERLKSKIKTLEAKIEALL